MGGKNRGIVMGKVMEGRVVCGDMGRMDEMMMEECIIMISVYRWGLW